MILKVPYASLATLDTPEATGGSLGGWFADIGGFLFVGFLLIVAIVVLIKLMKGIDSMQGHAAEAEARFAEELARLAEQNAGALKAAESGSASPTATPISAPIPVQESIHRPSSPIIERQKVASLDELVRNLVGLRVITDLEGRVPLPIPPEGLIYRMRKGGACLLLPRLESSDLMEYFCKRFDVVFVLMASGEVLVLERLQARVGDLAERSSSVIVPRM